MLNLIWLALLVLGVVTGALSGRLDVVSQAALTSAKSAVMDVALPLIGAMAFWLGLMRLAEKAGLIQLLARGILPIMRFLFPEIPSSHAALGSMMMSIAANMLGVSNAATPLGLKAMTDLNRLNTKPGVATNSMCTFLALNTSAIQLVPATAMTILTVNGAKNPTAIVSSTLLSTTIATCAAVIIVKWLQNLGPFRWDRQVLDPSEPKKPEIDTSDPLPRSALQPAPPLSFAGKVIVVLLLAFFFALLLQIASSGLHSGSATATRLSGVTSTLRGVSTLVIPFLVTFFPVYAALRRVSVFPEFAEGAKEGFQVAVRIIPYLVGMLVAIAIFRESGALTLLQSAIQPILQPIGVPADLLPMILMRPLSGSGSLAVLSDIAKRFGPDNLVTYMAATIYGSAETTFYVVAVYFGSVGVTKTRHAIPAGLLADLVGVLAAVAICRVLFG
jgi:spore maturation protein SpmA